ncbi:hypothetical protein FQA39_LY08463 [Lamprigera yunnana]|nr:hypothetical protein FQA39_LY08463 [Lamprigera yunnana]
MQGDEISLEAKKHLLRAHFGESYLKRHKKYMAYACSSRMREPARFLINYGKLDLFHFKRFDTIVLAIRDISGYNHVKKIFASPSLAMHLDTSLKLVCNELKHFGNIGTNQKIVGIKAHVYYCTEQLFCCLCKGSRFVTSKLLIVVKLKKMNSLEKVTEVTLYDPESDHCYNVFLNKEDAVRCETDAVFVQSLLFHASCTSTPTTSANIANVNSTNNEEIVQESQNCEQGNIASGSSYRIKCIRELHGILAEDDLQNEENVWSRLNDTLMYDNPDRFNTCSLRLLKDHMLEQVLKFRKYDSKEATESGKERLQTPWGNYMRQLMLVWDNYEKLGERAVKVGRPKKKELSQAKEDVEMAKNIRNAALRTIRKRGEIEEGNVEVLEDTLSFPESSWKQYWYPYDFSGVYK